VFPTGFLSSYHCVTYKENITPGTKLISCLDSAGNIIEPLGKEWVLEKNNNHRSSPDTSVPGKCFHDFKVTIDDVCIGNQIY
jgi:hypothetical protein